MPPKMTKDEQHDIRNALVDFEGLNLHAKKTGLIDDQRYVLNKLRIELISRYIEKTQRDINGK